MARVLSKWTAGAIATAAALLAIGAVSYREIPHHQVKLALVAKEPVPAAASLPAEAASEVSARAADLSRAHAAMDRHDYSLAVGYLDRQLDRLPTDMDALNALFQCMQVRITDYCNEGRPIDAANLLGQLGQQIQSAHQILQSEASDKSLTDIVAMESRFRSLRNSIVTAADKQANERIDAAFRLANEAHYHWYSFHFNDRDKVRAGLCELRWVRDAGPVLSRDTVARYQQALDSLKNLVADREWEPLLAEAGLGLKGNS
ncbi:MAG TPA: hypothetical protein VG722_12420 [Tepidisphaeraceae bacterium]|nr:hypothetical protein [Tepidisphaeraceae bacterium]